MENTVRGTPRKRRPRTTKRAGNLPCERHHRHLLSLVTQGSAPRRGEPRVRRGGRPPRLVPVADGDHHRRVHANLVQQGHRGRGHRRRHAPRARFERPFDHGERLLGRRLRGQRRARPRLRGGRAHLVRGRDQGGRRRTRAVPRLAAPASVHRRPPGGELRAAPQSADARRSAAGVRRRRLSSDRDVRPWPMCRRRGAGAVQRRLRRGIAPPGERVPRLHSGRCARRMHGDVRGRPRWQRGERDRHRRRRRRGVGGRVQRCRCAARGAHRRRGERRRRDAPRA